MFIFVDDSCVSWFPRISSEFGYDIDSLEDLNYDTEMTRDAMNAMNKYEEEEGEEDEEDEEDKEGKWEKECAHASKASSSRPKGRHAFVHSNLSIASNASIWN